MVVLEVPWRPDHGLYLGLNVLLSDGLPMQHPGGGTKGPAADPGTVRTQALTLCSPAARGAALSFRLKSAPPLCSHRELM